MIDERRDNAIQMLNEYLAAYEASRARVGETMASGASFTSLTDPVEQRNLARTRTIAKRVLDECAPGWREALKKVGFLNSADSVISEVAMEQVTLLAEGDKITERLRADADEIVAETLHHWVWNTHVTRRWAKREYGDAVAEAAKAVNKKVQEKSGRTDLGETKLFQELYSTEEPKPGKPRLRLVEKDNNPQTYRDLHFGAMSFSAGWFASVRNILAHSSELQLTKHEALEYLSALSIIARWADTARVQTPEE